MAPMTGADHDQLELQLKETIQSLYQILVQTTAYDTAGAASRPSREVLANEVRALEASLQAVHRTASTPDPQTSLPQVPLELVQRYIEAGRNPDIYTREYLEAVRRLNQVLRGKQGAFASFRDVLAGEMDKALPELREDTARVVAATGGRGAAGAGAGAGAGSGSAAAGGVQGTS